jgi:hypothetical protein
MEPEEALERVVAASHRPILEAWNGLASKADATILSALSEAIEAHRSLRKEAGLDGPPPEEAEARSESIRQYRHGCADEILPTLEMALEHHKPSQLPARENRASFTEALEASRSLEFRVEVRWGGVALETLPTDRFGRRTRKALARLISPARRADRSRTAPLRAVALHHLYSRVTPIASRFASEAAWDWARWVARLERACSAWAADALPVLTRVPDVEPFPGPAEPGEAEDGEAGGAGDAPRVGDDAWFRLSSAAEAFHAELTALSQDLPAERVREQAIEQMERAAMELNSDVRVVGSFVWSPPDPASDPPELRQLERTARALEAWDHQAAQRLAMYRAYLELLLGSTAVLERLAARTREVVLEPLGGLRAIGDALDELADEARSRVADAATQDLLSDLRRAADEVIAGAVASLPEPGAVSGELERAAGETIDALQSIVRQAPDTLVLHRLDDHMPTATRPEDTRTVPFLERARQSLDAMRVERIRRTTLELVPAVASARAAVMELPDVIQFAFQAASSELDGESAKASASTSASLTNAGHDTGDPGERAGRLAVEALERSAGVLRDVPEGLEVAIVSAGRRIDTEMATGAGGLLERLGAGRMQSQLLRARSRVVDSWLRTTDRLGPTVRRSRRFLRFRYLRARRSVRRLQSSVDSVLGDTTSVSARQAARTVRAFAHGDSGPGHVPLVYQRLFSLNPVQDPSFLVGRTAELAEVLKRWRRWREEDEVPLIVRGYPGTGVSSFLNGCQQMFSEQGASIVRLEVPDRLRSEAELANTLARTLGVDVVDTMDGLACNLLAASRDEVPDVVILDGLEHLYLRVPGGTDPLERLLTLMSETEPRMFWLAGVGQPAWQLMAKAEPIAVAQADDLVLGPLSVDRLKETVLQRHRRSGLRLRFVEPKEGRALLRRRVRRLRGTEGHQRLLEEDFFEQLHRISDGNMKLALFHWLLAADFESEEGAVSMRPLIRPDFAVLDALDVGQNFTLKAFLEHRTLTLDEHRAVFRLPRQESYQVFEALQNRRLIEELAPIGSGEAHESEIERTSRYRIRPLLVGAVTSHLRTRNIVH